MRFLANNNIKASGTLRENRVSKNCSIARKKAMMKGKRGFVQQQTSEENSATIVGWKANKVFFFTSNCDAKSPEVKVDIVVTPKRK